jgi:hypothetical protein
VEEFVLRPLKRDPTALHWQGLRVIMRIAEILFHKLKKKVLKCIIQLIFDIDIRNPVWQIRKKRASQRPKNIL